ncbi:hypothetical protein HDV06_003021 [Boothiomyces sp. JEL0866]|nr:hypothetical protein HDV06_003021 [Boothiomyces sp. JEL0866]
MTKLQDALEEDSSSDISDFSMYGSEHNLIRRISLSDPYLATPSRKESILEFQREIQNELSKSTGSIKQETPKSQDSRRTSTRRSISKRDSFNNSVRKATIQDTEFERKVLMEDIPEEKKKKPKRGKKKSLVSSVNSIAVHEGAVPEPNKLPEISKLAKPKKLPPAKPRQPPIASTIKDEELLLWLPVKQRGYRKEIEKVPIVHVPQDQRFIFLRKLSYFADIPQYHDMIRRIKPFQPEKWGVSKLAMKEKLY